MSDILLERTNNGYYDVSIADNGDLETTEGLDTAILMSLLCEKRADSSEVTAPQYRRGDWSNELNDVDDYEVGSKLWLLDQARANNESVNAGIDFIQDGLQWMIDDNLVKEVETGGEISTRGITFTISVTTPDNEVETYMIDSFEATGES